MTDKLMPKPKQPKAMNALLLTWDLAGTPRAIFQKLRDYIATESWSRYADRTDLCQKIWFSSERDSVFGAFYLWATEEALEEEIRTMYRVEEMTGVAPSIRRLDVEAIQEGQHDVTDLSSTGLAWQGGNTEPRRYISD